jgi:hypothetical protein
MEDADLELAANNPWLCTAPILEEDLSGARPPLYLAIAPSNGDRWAIATLAVLVNQRTAQ